MRFNIVAGVLDRKRAIGFERMLWRVSKGNVFVKFADIEELIEDPRTGDNLYKAVFIVFFQAVFRIHVFFGPPDPDPLVRGMDPDPALDPDPPDPSCKNNI
jgi:hypothetical protein